CERTEIATLAAGANCLQVTDNCKRLPCERYSVRAAHFHFGLTFGGYQDGVLGPRQVRHVGQPAAGQLGAPHARALDVGDHAAEAAAAHKQDPVQALAAPSQASHSVSSVSSVRDLAARAASSASSWAMMSASDGPMSRGSRFRPRRWKARPNLSVSLP